MLDVPPLRRSIGLTQTVAVLLASLLVGLGLSALQIAYSLDDRRNEALAHCNEILSLAEGGATSAAWSLDPEVAQRVVDAMMQATAVNSASLADERGVVLASAERANEPAGPLVRAFARQFLSDPLAASRELSVKLDQELRAVGTLHVALSTETVAQTVLALAHSTLLVTVLIALCVGLLLLVLSTRLVTSPLRRVARQMTDLDPEHPRDMVLEVPPAHRDNELGELVNRANTMLARLADNQEELLLLATRDALTGLANRELISERMRKAIAAARRRDHRLAVLYLDLDRFKTINDSLGHDVGDRLLYAVANILLDNVRAGDSIGRLGGDEFVILLEEIAGPDEASQTAERLVSALSGPISAGTREVRCTASIGISVFPDDGDDAVKLVRHADLAMYRAKQSGGCRWQFFAREMSERVDARLRMELALANALDNGELSLSFQPTVAAGSDKLTGCEALLRWHHDGQLLDANDFVHVAEDTGLILPIGAWVLEAACEQIAHWQQQGYRVPVAVNVSARQLAEAGFVETVMGTVRRHEIDPSLLSLEITETVLMVDPMRSRGDLEQLARMGVGVSVDDFGTGYSSLAYLAKLPVRSLKIDRSFVAAGEESRAILETIVAMAKALGLHTIGEGVENETEKALLRSIGCDELQGYFIGLPVAHDLFERNHLLQGAKRTLRRVGC